MVNIYLDHDEHELNFAYMAWARRELDEALNAERPIVGAIKRECQVAQWAIRN